MRSVDDQSPNSQSVDGVCHLLQLADCARDYKVSLDSAKSTTDGRLHLGCTGVAVAGNIKEYEERIHFGKV